MAQNGSPGPKKAMTSKELADILAPLQCDVYAFSLRKCYDKTIREVDIPYGIKDISFGAFDKCKKLKRATIPDTVTKIDHHAFQGCAALQEIHIPDSVKEIGEYAFNECSSLKNVTLSAGIEVIEPFTFCFCENLTEIEIPHDVNTIRESAFDACSSLEKITFPEGLTEIDEMAFNGCSSLTEIILPDSIEFIGKWAFDDCTGLKQVSLPDKEIRIGEKAIPESAEIIRRPLGSRAAVKTNRTVSEGGKGGMYRYNDQVSFDLPKGYIHRTIDGPNGNEIDEICYGKGTDDNGNETWEFRASILPGDSDALEGYTRKKNEKILDFYKRCMENTRFSEGATAPDTAVFAVKRPVRIFSTLLQFKVDGIIAVIDRDHLLVIQAALQQNDDDPNAEIGMFRHLMKVGNSLRINGKTVDFSLPDPKKLVKEMRFDFDEENDESSVNLGIGVKVKNGDGEETDGGTINISAKPDAGKKKVAAKKTGGKKRRPFVPIEQEGNRLIFGGCWSMELVSNCRLDREPLEDESTGKQYVIKSGTRDIWKFIIADDKDGQSLKSAVSEISQGVLEKLHEAHNIVDIELRSDDSLKVTLHASIAASGFSCVMVKVETPDGDTYALTGILPDIDDMGEAMEKINNEEVGVFHPFGMGWEAQWTLMMRMVASIRSLDDPEPDDQNWVIGGYEYELNPEEELIPGIRCRIPKTAMKLGENTYALTEFGLDKKRQVAGKNILTIGFVHSERDDPFDKQSSEPHNRLLVTHLGRGFASILREKRAKDFHACLGYIPIGNGKIIISMMYARRVAQIIIDCGESDNHPIPYEALECARKLFDGLRYGSMAEEAPTVFPPTPDFLHEHYDLVESGRYTTHRDADFTGQSIRILLEKHGNEDEEAYDLMKINGDTYSLDRDAVALARVFRLDSKLFDPYGDTEALIRKGMFKEARCFEALRSLAWTVSCMADRSGRAIGEYTYDELEKIGELIEEQNYLNYTAFSYMPGLCDHYDWHVFYVPDEYLRSEYQGSNDLRYLTGKENRGGNSISVFGLGFGSLGSMNRTSDLIGRNEETLESLDALRKDLETLLPVMETIHDGLLDGRDRSENLVGVLPDALTAWCALAIAAKEPFYSEEAANTYEADAGLDGPLERPTDQLDDKPVKAGRTVKKASGTSKAAAKPKAAAAKKTSAKPAGEVLDLDGETVIKPGQFAGNMALKNIVIPEGVTEIGEQAFNSCMFLESVVFPKSLKKIGKMAFMSCRALKKVELQEGVEELETHVFGATNNLKEVRLPDSLKKVDRTVFGMGGDSPYATAYMSGDLAKRLMEEYNKNNSWPSDAIYARHYVIDGVGYENMTDFWKPKNASSGIFNLPESKTAEEYRVDMEKACKAGKPLQDMIDAAREAVNADAFGDKGAFEQAVANLDRDTTVDFSGKHFVLTGFGDYEGDVIAEIEKRGGVVHSSMVKMADYLVVCLESPGASKVKKALEWRQKGAENLIVSDYQLWQAIFGKAKSASAGKAAAAKPAAKTTAKSTTTKSTATAKNSTKAGSTAAVKSTATTKSSTTAKKTTTEKSTTKTAAKPAAKSSSKTTAKPAATKSTLKPDMHVLTVGPDSIRRVNMGEYPAGKPITWQILDSSDGETYLMISEYGLDARPFCDWLSKTTNEWAGCSLRAWLNNDFLNAAFTGEEKNKILTVTRTNFKKTANGFEPVETTSDKVSLLDADEARKYFPNEKDRLCKATAFAKMQGAEVTGKTDICHWWLRSPAVEAMGLPMWSPRVQTDGSINGWGYGTREICVRPVIRVKQDFIETELIRNARNEVREKIQKTGSKGKYTVDMLPEGQEDAEALVAELNEMDPKQAEETLSALIAANNLLKELQELNDMLGGDTGGIPASQPQPTVNRTQTNREAEERRRRDEEERRRKARASLQNEIAELERERDAARGLFAGMKRKKLQRRIDELQERLSRT